MFASEGEILTLRPEGFVPDKRAIEAFLQSLPGSYRRSASAPWVLVAPAADMPRLLAEPMPPTSRPGEPQYAMVNPLDDGLWVHPGLTPATWARAQNVVIWLLGLGPWRITGDEPGQDRKFGVVRSPSELFDHLYPDPDIHRLDTNNPTESPPRVGELVTFRRYLGDVESNKYFHTFVRVHSSSAFSCEMKSELDDLRWVGRLSPEFSSRWKALVSGLDFEQSSPGWEGDFHDRVAVIVERPTDERTNTLDAEHPPESFAALVRLMDGWARDLLDGKLPVELADIRTVASG